MPAFKLSLRFRNLPTALAIVTASVAVIWLALSAKAEYERDIRLGERQTQLLATGLQDTTERQFNEINREVIAILGVIERQIAMPGPTRLELGDLAPRAFDDDGDILRIIVRIDGRDTVNQSPMGTDIARVDTEAIAWSTAETAFPFGFVNVGVPVALPEGGYTVPLRYTFVAGADHSAFEIIALTDPKLILQGYKSVELADGSAFAVFRSDGVLLTRWPATPDFVGRKFEGPIFGGHIKQEPSATIRASVEIDPQERIFTYRSTRGWPLVVVAGVPVRGLLTSWLSSLPGKLVLLLFILSAILLLWVALRSLQSDLRRSVEQLTVSEGRYARLLANIPGGVFTRRLVPPDGIEYTFVSEGFRHAFGLQTDPSTPDTASLLDLVHPDDRRQMQESILASRDGDDVWTQDFRAIKPNGQLIWVQSVARRYHGEDGGILWDGIAIDVTDVHQQQTLLENVQKIAGLGYWIWQPEPGNDSTDQSRRHTRYSPACAAILGLKPADLQFSDAAFVEKLVHPEDRARVAREYQHFLEVEGAPHDIQYRILRPDGSLRWVHCTATKDVVGGKVVRIIGVLQDVTEAKLHEAQLVQAQKMEAIGGLTGGVAHDFNNLLTVVIGNLEAMIDRLRDQPQMTELAKAAMGAAERGATLTRRLLAFARRQPLSPQPIDLHRLLVDLLPLLNRSVGALIDVKLKAAPDLPKAIVDPNQLENAILNLANNARDAMPRGGRLSIGVDLADWTAEADGEATAEDSGNATAYLRISVTDTGVGMTPETLARAVEPFFTTKPVGQGTGLGLSMAYGLAKQSRGHLRIYSEPGIGTTVRLYLPVATGAVAGVAAPGDSAGDFAGVSALLVDDDPPVRATTAAILRSLGMTVSEAPNGKEAMRILEGVRPIDVLVTDVILAGGMLGPEVAQRALAVRPGLKVLFISGFASDTLVEHRPLLSKPFRRAEMAAELAKLLGR